jgi:hypothetical protein
MKYSTVALILLLTTFCQAAPAPFPSTKPNREPEVSLKEQREARFYGKWKWFIYDLYFHKGGRYCAVVRTHGVVTYLGTWGVNHEGNVVVEERKADEVMGLKCRYVFTPTELIRD